MHLLLIYEMESSVGDVSATRDCAKQSAPLAHKWCVRLCCGRAATEVRQRTRHHPSCQGIWGRRLLLEGCGLCTALCSCSNRADSERWQSCVWIPLLVVRSCDICCWPWWLLFSSLFWWCLHQPTCTMKVMSITHHLGSERKKTMWKAS